MKTAKRILAAALSVILAGGLCSCSTPADSGSSGADDSERSAAIAAEPKEISFLLPGFDGTDETSPYYKAIKELEQVYGKSVNVMTTVGDQTWNQKVAAQVAAGDPIDVFMISVEQYLGMYQKGYTKAVDEYVDLKQPWHRLSVMDDYVKHDGHYYAAAVSATPYVIFYNRDILANNGYDADEPQKLYESGEWTWSKFVEMARECTDTEAGIMGMENMYDEVFQASNACAAVNYVDNKYELNIMSDKMRSTLEMVQDIFHTNPICGNGYVTGQNKFLKGKAAFHGAYAYEEPTFGALKEAGSINIDIGVTAFPVGPENTEGYSFGHSSGFAIASGTDAPYTSGMLIDLIGKYNAEKSESEKSRYTEAHQKLYEKLSEKLYIPSYTDGILEEGFGAFYLLYYVRQGDDINSVRATYQTVYQKMVDDANALL